MINYTMFACFNAMAAERGIPATAHWAAEHGFSSVEVQYSRCPEIIFTRKEAAAARRVLAEHNLSSACYSVSSNLYEDPDAAVRLVCHHLDLAAALGSPYLHHTLLPWLVLPDNAPTYDAALETVLPAAERIARYAGRLGITVLYEDQGLYFNGVDGFAPFWREIHRICENTGVCGDMGNSLFVDEGAEHFFDAFRNDIRHVHVKDYLKKSAPVSPGLFWRRTKGGAWLRDTMAGSGVVDFAACGKILSDIDYRGAVSLELFHPEPYADGVKQAMQYFERYFNYK
ncbi:MAG: sugar phosphate isomerase/epimerase [Clostridia bacterium]|nr:sugar phosphate isomerase/epimerase [Clostridia bacterium]